MLVLVVDRYLRPIFEEFVPLDAHNVLRFRVGINDRQIVGQRGIGRPGNERLDLRGYWVEAAHRDHIARKWVGHRLTVCRSGGGRVVDRVLQHGPPQNVRPQVAASQDIAEVTGPPRRGGNVGKGPGNGLLVAVAFVVEEKEGLVATIVYFRNKHWTTDAGAVIVLPHAWTKQMAVSAVRKRDAGSQIFIGKVLKPAAVELVGAGARGEVEEATHHLPEFRREVAGLKRKLLHRLHGWHRLIGILQRIRLGGVLAIQHNFVALIRHAVDADLLVAGCLVDRARRERGEGQRVPDGPPALAAAEIQRKRQ